MTISRLMGLILVSLIALPTQGLARCDARFSQISTIDLTAGQAYQAFDVGRRTIAVPFRVVGAPQECRLVVGFASTGNRRGLYAARSGRFRLTYQLTSDEQGRVLLADVPPARPNDLLRLAPSDASQGVSGFFFVQLADGQAIGPGQYRDRLNISLYRVNGASFERLDTTSITVLATVHPAVLARLSVGGLFAPLGSMAPQLDFGTLRAGAVRDFQLSVEANTPYRVIIQSQNKGFLKGDSRPGAGAFSNLVAYQLDADGKPVSLSRRTTLSQSPRGAGPVERIHRMRLTIGKTSRALSGAYRDELILTVEAR